MKRMNRAPFALASAAAIIFGAGAARAQSLDSDSSGWLRVSGHGTQQERLSIFPQPGAWSLQPVRSADPWVAVESWGEPLGGARPLALPDLALAVKVDDDEASALSIEGLLDLLRDVEEEPSASGPCELALDSVPSFHLWDDDVWVGAPWPHIERNGHTLKEGKWEEYDQIGRRWDRPESYASYRYPVPSALVASGYDLDRPDEKQRRGPHLSAIGHGGVDLAEEKGTPIRMVALDHQIGDAEVLFVGHLFGTSVVTRHTLREGGKRHDYIVIFGHLDKAGDGVWRGRRLRAGETVGFVGDTDSPEFVHLHLEARRMREGVDAWKVPAWSLDAREVSVVCDPRNVLPLRVPWHAKKKACAPALVRPAAATKVWFAPMTLTLGGADDEQP
jgi:hypothetical protein